MKMVLKSSAFYCLFVSCYLHAGHETVTSGEITPVSISRSISKDSSGSNNSTIVYEQEDEVESKQGSVGDRIIYNNVAEMIAEEDDEEEIQAVVSPNTAKKKFSLSWRSPLTEEQEIEKKDRKEHKFSKDNYVSLSRRVLGVEQKQRTFHQQLADLEKKHNSPYHPILTGFMFTADFEKYKTENAFELDAIKFEVKQIAGIRSELNAVKVDAEKMKKDSQFWKKTAAGVSFAAAGAFIVAGACAWKASSH
jgi:hypothetical protein